MTKTCHKFILCDYTMKAVGTLINVNTILTDRIYVEAYIHKYKKKKTQTEVSFLQKSDGSTEPP